VQHITRTKTLLAATLLATSVLAAAPAFAHPEEGLAGDFTGNIALTTNYIYRGVSQSNDGPAVQGGFDYGVDLFYAGVWASSVEWDGTSIETDFYAGFTPSAGQFDFDIGVLYYGYPDSPDLPEQDFYEFYGGVSTAIAENIEVGVKVSFSPDFYGETGEAYYPEFNVGVTLTDNWSFSAHVGQQTFEDDMQDDYTDWNIGVTYSWDWFDVSLGYYDTTDRIGGDEDDAVVLTISRSF
jgi:uncharacterized protein (TIGR02001 family)